MSSQRSRREGTSRRSLRRGARSKRSSDGETFVEKRRRALKGRGVLAPKGQYSRCSTTFRKRRCRSWEIAPSSSMRRVPPAAMA